MSNHHQHQHQPQQQSQTNQQQQDFLLYPPITLPTAPPSFDTSSNGAPLPSNNNYTFYAQASGAPPQAFFPPPSPGLIFPPQQQQQQSFFEPPTIIMPDESVVPLSSNPFAYQSLKEDQLNYYSTSIGAGGEEEESSSIMSKIASLDGGGAIVIGSLPKQAREAPQLTEIASTMGRTVKYGYLNNDYTKIVPFIMPNDGSLLKTNTDNNNQTSSSSIKVEKIAPPDLVVRLIGDSAAIYFPATAFMSGITHLTIKGAPRVGSSKTTSSSSSSSSQMLTHVGFSALVPCFSRLNTLRIEGCNISKLSGMAIADALVRFNLQQLEHLDLWNDHIDDETADYIVRNVLTMKSIKSINLGENYINPEKKLEIKKICKAANVKIDMF